MDSKATWRLEVLSAVDSKSKSMDVNAQITKFTWRIENFSSIKDEGLYSEYFTVDGNKWRIFVNRWGISLEVAESSNLPFGWSRYAQIGFAVIDQIDRKSSSTTVSTKVHQFGTMNHIFFSHPYLVVKFTTLKEVILSKMHAWFELYVSIDRTEGLISRDFTILEAELLTSSIIFSHEDAKDALSKVDEALNILARVNGSSMKIATKQKYELPVIEERLKELADRAVKAAQDKHHLTENQSAKTLQGKEVDSMVKQVEQKLAALLAERKEIFRSSKEIKTELEEYEAKAKVVEEEERRMKDFISSVEE